MAAKVPNLEQAVTGWRGLLGADRVLMSPAELGRFGASTQASSNPPAGVIAARSTQEVVEAVGIARAHGVPLYPVSQGRNWGYGDACPVGPGQVVLDLSAMNRIIEVDPELAYAVIEPGVTQGQLNRHLEELGYPLVGSCTGSSPAASVIGNLLERGFGLTSYSDHAAHVCGLEVVLADSSILRTGFGQYPHSPSAHLYRWGLGPYLDGLFAQSNLGVVVKAGVWLMPQPEAFTTFSLEIEADRELERAIDRFRTLRLQGTLTSQVFIANVFRTLAHMGRYPWHETGGAVPLERAKAEALVRRRGVPGMAGRWNAIGSLHGSRRALKAAVKDTEESLAGLGKLNFTSPADIDRFERRGRILSRLPGLSSRGAGMVATARMARPGLAVFRGVPSEGALAITRWRLRKPVKGRCEDPSGEGSGLYWIAPVCPARGSEVSRCVQIIEEQMLALGFEPLIRIAAAHDRSVFVTTLLSFDREHPEEASRARDCHRDLIAKLIEAGYPPYRAGVDEMDLLDPHGSTSWAVAAALKRALDPEGVLAPGRYEPEVASQMRSVRPPA